MHGPRFDDFLQIEVNAQHLMIGDHRIDPHTPASQVFGGIRSESRVLPKNKDRELIIVDRLGLLALRDGATDRIYWITVEFEKMRGRPLTESDPAGVFGGSVKIGRLVLKAPVDADLEGVIHRAPPGAFEFNAVVQDDAIASLCISFRMNSTITGGGN
jgi:hypothetical protein